MSEFVECLNCSTIHYVVDEATAKSLKGKLADGFSSRDLTRCSSCGSKKNFSVVSEFYMGFFSPSDKTPPIFLDYGKLKKIAEDKYK